MRGMASEEDLETGKLCCELHGDEPEWWWEEWAGVEPPWVRQGERGAG